MSLSPACSADSLERTALFTRTGVHKTWSTPRVCRWSPLVSSSSGLGGSDDRRGCGHEHDDVRRAGGCGRNAPRRGRVVARRLGGLAFAAGRPRCGCTRRRGPGARRTARASGRLGGRGRGPRGRGAHWAPHRCLGAAAGHRGGRRPVGDGRWPVDHRLARGLGGAGVPPGSGSRGARASPAGPPARHRRGRARRRRTGGAGPDLGEAHRQHGGASRRAGRIRRGMRRGLPADTRRAADRGWVPDDGQALGGRRGPGGGRARLPRSLGAGVPRARADDWRRSPRGIPHQGAWRRGRSGVGGGDHASRTRRRTHHPAAPRGSPGRRRAAGSGPRPVGHRVGGAAPHQRRRRLRHAATDPCRRGRGGPVLLGRRPAVAGRHSGCARHARRCRGRGVPPGFGRGHRAVRRGGHRGRRTDPRQRAGETGVRLGSLPRGLRARLSGDQRRARRARVQWGPTPGDHRPRPDLPISRLFVNVPP